MAGQRPQQRVQVRAMSHGMESTVRYSPEPGEDLAVLRIGTAPLLLVLAVRSRPLAQLIRQVQSRRRVRAIRRAVAG